MKKLLTILVLLIAESLSAQHLNAGTIGVDTVYDNLLNQKLFSDSLASSFIILIRKEVREHKHAFHSEHIYVIDGKAEMTVGDSTFIISKNDVVFIPKNTFHSVKTLSKVPLKVLSVQSPYFDGSDRVFK